MQLTWKLHGDVALGVGRARHGIVKDLARAHAARTLHDVNGALKQERVRFVIERTVIGIDHGIGLHVMDVSEGFVDLGGSVDLRFVRG